MKEITIGDIQSRVTNCTNLCINNTQLLKKLNELYPTMNISLSERFSFVDNTCAKIEKK